MTNLDEIENVLPFLGNQNSPDAPSGSVHDDMTLEDKLHVLGRASYSGYFQELRNNEPITPKLKSAFDFLKQDPFSVRNRECAVRVTATHLWPEDAWNYAPLQLMYLRIPYGWFKDNISQRALIRVNQAKNPVSTVMLIGQHGRREFDLRDSSQLYKLFEAVIDSEFTFIWKEERRYADALQQIQPLQSTSLATPCLCARFSILGNNGMYAQCCKVRLRTRVHTIKYETQDEKEGRPHRRLRGRNTFKLPFQPGEPSNLRYELLQREEIPFHLITWPRIESVTLPAHLAESLNWEDFITVNGEAGNDHDESLLFYLMGLAAFRLVDERMHPLARELNRLQVLLSRSRRGADSPFGPTSGQLTPAPVGLNDNIYIICSDDVSDKIRIWIVDAGQGRKSWMVRIEKYSEDASRTISTLGKRGVSSAPRVYREIAPKRPRLE